MLGSLNTTEMARFKSNLLTYRAELTERLEAIKKDIAKKRSADSSEQATEVENAEVLRELAREAEEELGKVAAALTRYNDGMYGLCQQCNSAIDRKRLLAYPSTVHCITCMRDHEVSANKVRN